MKLGLGLGLGSVVRVRVRVRVRVGVRLTCAAEEGIPGDLGTTTGGGAAKPSTWLG